jgi:hypothetical protein
VLPSPRDVVGERRLLRLAVEQRPVDGDGRVVGERLHEAQLLVVEDGAVEAVDHLDDAVEPVVVDHGHAQHAVRHEAGDARDVRVVTRVAARVVEAEGRSARAATQPTMPCPICSRMPSITPCFERAGDTERHLAELGVVEDERRVLARHHRRQPGEDRVQHLGVARDAVEVAGRGERGRERRPADRGRRARSGCRRSGA